MSELGIEDWSDVAPSSDDRPLRCEVCGESLTYSGRGRYPTRCSEHKKSPASKGTKSTPSMAQLETAIADMYRGIGMGLTFVDPFDGMTIAEGSDKLAHSWIVLAESNPKMKAFLVKLATGGGWGAVIIAHAMVAYPILAHHDMLPSFGQGTSE